MYPTNPIVAVTSPDPYPYYAELLQNQPFYWDETIAMWVAADAATVKVALNHPALLVRPLTEPIPKTIVGSPGGDVFGKLVRMNDGAFHQKLKPVVTQTLAQVNLSRVAELGQKYSRLLLASCHEAGYLSNFVFTLPLYIIVDLLGVTESDLPLITDWLKAFVQSYTKNTGNVEAAAFAVTNLLEIFSILLTAHESVSENSLLLDFDKMAKTANIEADIVLANTIGFLSQTYEATAGLIANSLLAIAAFPQVYTFVATDFRLIDLLVMEVLRHNPPIQNTRRFVSEATILAGQKLTKGETVLVLLAAANRDPYINPEPARFDLFRQNRQTFSFGNGRHSCPGSGIAQQIARVAIEELLRAGLVPTELPASLNFYPSVNARIALL